VGSTLLLKNHYTTANFWYACQETNNCLNWPSRKFMMKVTTLGDIVNQTPSGRIINIMVLDLVPHRLGL